MLMLSDWVHSWTAATVYPSAYDRFIVAANSFQTKAGI